MSKQTCNTLNIIRLAQRRGHLTCRSWIYKNDLPFIRLLYRLGCIRQIGVISYVKADHRYWLQLRLQYYYNTPAWLIFSKVTTVARRVFITWHGLTLVQRRLGATPLIIATQRGLLTHHEAIQQRVGGMVVGFFM